MSTTLSIVMPYYGRLRFLEPTVKQISQYPASVEILLMDDGCPKPILPTIQALPGKHRISVVRMPDPKVPWNLPACFNRGAVLAQGTFLLMLAADHLLSPQHAEFLVNWLEAGNLVEGEVHGLLARKTPTYKLAPGTGIVVLHRREYLRMGGLDEQYCGNYGYGGNDFRRRLRGYAIVVPNIFLSIYTRGEVSCEEYGLTRDTTVNKTKFDNGPRELAPLADHA